MFAGFLYDFFRILTLENQRKNGKKNGKKLSSNNGIASSILTSEKKKELGFFLECFRQDY